MIKSLRSVLIIVAVGLALLGLTVYTVYESDRAIIARLGELKKDADGQVKIYGPGLHCKIPMIDVVHIFDMRYDALFLYFGGKKGCNVLWFIF